MYPRLNVIRENLFNFILCQYIQTPPQHPGQHSHLLHNVIELQHGVGRRVDEHVGQRVLVVVHLI